VLVVEVFDNTLWFFDYLTIQTFCQPGYLNTFDQNNYYATKTICSAVVACVI
jgi:hypothetical protein